MRGGGCECRGCSGSDLELVLLVLLMHVVRGGNCSGGRLMIGDELLLVLVVLQEL